MAGKCDEPGENPPKSPVNAMCAKCVEVKEMKGNEGETDLLELLDGTLVNTTALVDQVTSGGRLAGIDVADNDDVDVSLVLLAVDEVSDAVRPSRGRGHDARDGDERSTYPILTVLRSQIEKFEGYAAR